MSANTKWTKSVLILGSLSHSGRVGKLSSLALGIEMVSDESASYKSFLDRMQENLHMI